MQERYSLQEAQSKLAELIERAAAGQDVIIGDPNGPLVVMRRYELPKEKRTLGSLKGRIAVADEFDAPSPELMRKLGL